MQDVLTHSYRPYIVQAGGKAYCRNQRHLLAVPEHVSVQPTTAPQQPPTANKQKDAPSFFTFDSPTVGPQDQIQDTKTLLLDVRT